MSRLGDVLEVYFRARASLKESRTLLNKTILLAAIALLALSLRLVILYLILKALNLGPIGWVLFWIQIPFLLAVDLLEKKINQRGY